jgi:hypothetical protein
VTILGGLAAAALVLLPLAFLLDQAFSAGIAEAKQLLLRHRSRCCSGTACV